MILIKQYFLLPTILIVCQNNKPAFIRSIIYFWKACLIAISYIKNQNKNKTYIIDPKINFRMFSILRPSKKYTYIEKETALKNYIKNNNELLMSEEQFQQTYIIIKSKLIKNKTPVSSPIAITLGGQPGAGKSNLYEIAKKRFANNIVELDLDQFRIYHPYYWQIKKIYGKKDAIKTNPFAFKMVDILIEEFSAQKYNLIIESSLNSPYSALSNGKNMPPKGYKVELQIMATPKEISWQGTIDRYKNDIKNRKSSRSVSKEFHDRVVSNICNSLEIVQKSGLMSNILIYNRNKNCLYDMKKDPKTKPCILLNSIINGFKTY